MEPLYKGHLSNEDTVCSPNHIELCTNLPLNEGHLSIQDSQLGPSGVLYREVPLYTGQPAGSQGALYREVPLYTGQQAGSQWCPLLRGSTVYRTTSWVPVVPSIERFHCIQDSKLGPNGVHYREVPLYTGQPAGSQWCPL